MPVREGTYPEPSAYEVGWPTANGLMDNTDLTVHKCMEGVRNIPKAGWPIQKEASKVI